MKNELTITESVKQISGSRLDSRKSRKMDSFCLEVERIEIDSDAYVFSFSLFNSSGIHSFQTIPLSKMEILKFRLFLRMAYDAKRNLTHNLAEFYEVSVTNNTNGTKNIVLKIDQEIATLLSMESEVNLELSHDEYLKFLSQLAINVYEEKTWEIAA